MQWVVPARRYDTTHYCNVLQNVLCKDKYYWGGGGGGGFL